MKTMEGFAVVYKNEDGTFSFGELIHKTPACAIASIPFFSGQMVVDTIPVTFQYDESKLISGMEYRLQNIDLIKSIPSAEPVTTD